MNEYNASFGMNRRTQSTDSPDDAPDAPPDESLYPRLASVFT
jgi:hypothetical protein